MNALIKQESKYDDKVSKVVDKVLRQVFGDEAAHIIYQYLENRYTLRQDEIIEKIDIFAEGLEEFLKSGAFVIETKILEDLYSNHGLAHGLEFGRISRRDFVSQVKLLRKT